MNTPYVIETDGAAWRVQRADTPPDAARELTRALAAPDAARVRVWHGRALIHEWQRHDGAWRAS